MATKPTYAHACIKVSYIINMIYLLHVSVLFWPSSGRCKSGWNM